ncbi:hypothetical protein NIES2135_18080 [Leptolyngbya boryana NIES-2135]|jgi:hypothetical protein|uniref:DUF29 domain-containing protein n=1 Tax=Leptolyngbya boryana NIES-2135 TaxID=1973484 RepID=A0A1Z4JET7_LEPBY|nr:MULTISPECIES: DUF29 domain-containing protein [Leptolyngbya]BAY54987.1 hypothetical protein NIES2135_18080 [Leptolyngbya boryana NIES-2135]MBD2365967.1 DUF29 domain-containing protein [Leptolyngbya sp. FACHB-161]MBD2372147.1 DUF29 domain-containing protein [Leptolyngbya sp. FACHB-238]MBD2396570.1 DUF29 domain-containing protein [Leptolyngbya sp. FACHB-239]MBD2403093.1 DUF29 domain-containing protein [Leptolyngbya sp. FACHB-402]
MKSEVTVNSKSLYDTDYQLWIDQTVAQLKAQEFREIDLENLIEEIESLGRSEKHAMSSYLMRLCEHLLKIKYWESERETCFRGWDIEVANFRLQIQELLETSPSLKSFSQDIFSKQYKNGRKLFLKASQLSDKLVPVEPWFTLEQALEEDWLPWQPESFDR